MKSELNTEQIAKHIGILFGAYGQANDVNRQLIYVSDLEEFPADLVGDACKKLRYESNDNFLPSVGKIVEACQSLANTSTGKGDVSWLEAQKEIQDAVSKYSFYHRPKFSRPEIEQAVMAFGWTLFCTARADNMATVWAQIRRNYEMACKNKRETQVNRYVLKERQGGYLGFQEVSNSGLLPITISFPENFVESKKLAESHN